MGLEASVLAGEAVNTLLNREDGMTLSDLAKSALVSDAQAGHLKRNYRKMNQDTAKLLMQAHDYYDFTMQLLHSFSDGSSSPLFNGPRWEDHRATAKQNAFREMMDVINKFNVQCLSTPPDMVTTQEWESIRKLFREGIEARSFIDNFLVVLEKAYNLSVKQETDLLMNKWITEGWIKNEC